MVLACLSVSLQGLRIARMNSPDSEENCKILPDLQLMLTERGKTQKTHNITKEETWKAWHHQYQQNEFRLQQAMQKLMAGKEEMTVVGIGGSISGMDCRSEKGNWVTQLREILTSTYGSKVKVLNMAMPGTTSSRAMQAYYAGANIHTADGGVVRNYKQILDAADLIISEYHFNDLFHASAARANEKLVYTLLNLPKKPALVYLDLPGPKNLRSHYMGDVLPNFAKSLHYDSAKRFEVPAIWFADLERQIDFDVWHGGNHPQCDTQTIMAKLVHDVLQDTMASVCKDGVKGKDTVLVQSNEIKSWLKCAHNLAFQADASNGEKAFPVKSAGQWVFKEDRAGKPGWIASEGSPTEIVFTGLPIEMGRLTIEYLQTYENIGDLTCTLEKDNTQVKSITLNGLWKEQVSLTSNSQLADIPKGKYDLRCRSDGKKFKLTGIQTC